MDLVFCASKKCPKVFRLVNRETEAIVVNSSIVLLDTKERKHQIHSQKCQLGFDDSMASIFFIVRQVVAMLLVKGSEIVRYY